ncbi:MAG TPA: hypothetical protein VHT25_05690 [Solirubrobacteraceae bacterium]|nr:hypothetical protein [Solirubrobacteraceae bacterium]
MSLRGRFIAGRGPLYAVAGIGFIAAVYIRTEWVEVTVVVVATASFVAGLTASVLRWQDRRNSAAADQQD